MHRSSRQRNGDDRAAARLAVDLKRTTVGFCDKSAQVQSQAGPAGRPTAGGVRPVERLRDALKVLGGDPVPVIAHAQFNVVARTAGTDLHLLVPGWAVAQRVLNQVSDQQAHPGYIELSLQAFIGLQKPNATALFCIVRVDYRVHELAQIRRLPT